VNRLGSGLYGIVGHHSASIENFDYSPAMKAFDKVRDAARLDGFLADPRAPVPGPKMTFSGLKDAKDRQNVIGYLASLSPVAAA
jgi:cytochrome c